MDYSYNSKCFLLMTINIVVLSFICAPYFLMKYQNEAEFYLIKANLVFQIQKKSKFDLSIPVFYFTNSKYTLYTIVSITSIMVHSTNHNIMYDVYVIVEPNFPDIQRKRLKSLEKKYKRLTITITEFTKTFPSSLKSFAHSYSTYFRLYLPDIFLNINRGLIFDSDAFILKDLDEFYLLDMNDIYYRGCYDVCEGNMSRYNFYNDHYICAGIMLANFDLIRKENLTKKYDETIVKYGHDLGFVDQTILNIAAKEKTAFLPIKFCEFNHFYLNFELNPNSTEKYYSREDEKKAIDNLTLCHLIRKPWHKSQLYRPYNKLWFDVAYQTDYFDLIAEKIKWLLKHFREKVVQWGNEHGRSNIIDEINNNMKNKSRKDFIGD